MYISAKSTQQALLIISSYGTFKALTPVPKMLPLFNPVFIDFPTKNVSWFMFKTVEVSVYKSMGTISAILMVAHLAHWSLSQGSHVSLKPVCHNSFQVWNYL